MSAVIVVAMLVVAVCLGARFIAPLAHAAGGLAPLDVEVLHGLMGLTMTAMVLEPISRDLSRGAFVLFGLGVVWCLVRVARTGTKAMYVRLAICCTAMVSMLVPASTSRPAAAGSMRGMAGMPGMSGTRSGGLPPTVVVVLLLALMGVVLAVGSRLGGPRSVPPTPTAMHRVQAIGEMAMAGAMAYMLGGLV